MSRTFSMGCKERKEISSGGEYVLLTWASEGGGWTVEDRDRGHSAKLANLSEKSDGILETLWKKEENLLHLRKRLESRTSVDSSYSSSTWVK